MEHVGLYDEGLPVGDRLKGKKDDVKKKRPKPRITRYMITQRARRFRDVRG